MNVLPQRQVMKLLEKLMKAVAKPGLKQKMAEQLDPFRPFSEHCDKKQKKNYQERIYKTSRLCHLHLCQIRDKIGAAIIKD